MTLYQMGTTWNKPPSSWFPELSHLAQLSLDFHVLQHGTKQLKSYHEDLKKKSSVGTRIPMRRRR